MENTKFTEIEATIKALNKELKPLFDEVCELNLAIEELSENKDTRHPLNELIMRITRTARRHNLDTKVETNGSGYTIGTNHQGLGIEHSYSSQLSPVISERAYDHTSEEQQVRDILFNSDAVIDLTSIIKKSNQKTFLKIVKILNKGQLKKAFGNYKKDNINNSTIDLKEDYQIEVVLRGFETHINLLKDSSEISSLELRNKDERPTISTKDEDDDLLKEISSKRYKGLSISDLKTAILISQHKKELLEAVKSKREALKSVSKGYKTEHSQLNDLLQPLLALENL